MYFENISHQKYGIASGIKLISINISEQTHDFHILYILD